jgi:hypothetical protein
MGSGEGGGRLNRFAYWPPLRPHAEDPVAAVDNCRRGPRDDAPGAAVDLVALAGKRRPPPAASRGGEGSRPPHHVEEEDLGRRISPPPRSNSCV